MTTDLDLTDYDNNLEDGDYFTYDIPAPMSVDARTMEIEDEHGWKVADVVITSNGEHAGGKVMVTMKNLDKYKQASLSITSVSGNINSTFRIKKAVPTATPLPLKGYGKNDRVNIIAKSSQGGAYDTTIQNFSKAGGVIQKKEWTSAALGRSGSYWHPWNVYVNTNKTDRKNFVLKDTLKTEGYQFIPETFKLIRGTLRTDTRGYINQKGQFEVVDITQFLSFNSDYTQFTLDLGNIGTEQYFLTYSTTAKNVQGTTITNYLEATENVELVKPFTNRSNVAASATQSSVDTSGASITIKPARSIILYKRDKETGRGLNGVKFRLTDPNGVSTEFVTADNSQKDPGVYQTPRLTEGEYTLEEIETLPGYKLDTTPRKINVTQDGHVVYWDNVYAPTPVEAMITAKKALVNRALKANEFTFILKNATSVIARATNDADGNITFSNVKFSRPGTYHYTISELNNNLPGVTYDTSVKNVEIVVADDGTGKLVVTSITGAGDTDALFTNTYQAKKIKRKLTAKKILSGRSLKANEFEFILKNQDGTVVSTTKNKADGSIEFPEITYDRAGTYQYKIEEVVGSELGITYDPTPIEITVEVTDDLSRNLTTSLTYKDLRDTFSNIYVKPSRVISVTKTWSDGENQDGKRPNSVEVELLADGTRTGQSLTLDASNNWQASFSNLDKYDSSDNEIAYTVAEKTVPTGYRSTITGDMASGFVVTNSHTPETLTVAGTKTWDDADDQDGLRPASITVRLMKSVDGSQPVEVASPTVGQAEAWKYSFKNQPKYEGGKEIAYSITEDAVADYQSTITGYQVTNTHTPAKRTVSVTKAWDDGHDQDGKRPSTVKVQLYADGQKSGTEVTLKAEDGWSHTWSELPVKKSGREIVYTVKEVSSPSGYTASVTGDMSIGFTITNSHTPSTTQFEVTKVWKDKSNQDGKRPSTITVNLLADGEKVSDATFGPDGDGNWKHTFTNLPEYKNGTKIVYSVSEEAVAGYTSKVKDHTITNSYTPETMTIAGEKTWNDSNDQDGKRPSKITVNLMKSVDGQAPSKVASKEVSQADDWKYSFKDQPKYEGGKEITYSISEETVAHYTSQVNGYNLTNSYSPEKTEVSGSKTWDDADNQDGKRPASITVHLLANGSLVDSKTVSAADAWSYRFSDLPKYKNGEVITYSISEASVAGYTTRVDQFNLINSYTPEKMDITVKKNWDDAQNQDGKRPSEITVHLLADGQKVASKKVTADSEGKWVTTFVAQPKYKAGQEIKYTISEDTVANYTTEIKDFDITNSYQPQVVDYEVIKKWDDGENQDGKRPDKITIHLMKRVAGTTTEVESKEISSADNWRYRFSQLPKYEAGQEITYSVTEDSVAGYTTSITDHEITNSHTPETVRILGKKIWEDDNNQAGKRPSSITVEIRKGREVVDTITVSPDGDGNWNFVSKELPKYEAGQEIRYQVFETSRVAGYEEGLVSEENGQYTITNKLTPEQKISVTGEVIWNDDGNQSGKRPSTVTIHLIVDGRVKESKVVRADSEGKWRYEFKDLPRYKSGKEIVYKISADTVDGYQLRVDGTTVIHTRQSSSKAQPNSSPNSAPSVPNGKPQGLDKGALVTPDQKLDRTGVSEGAKLPKEEVQQIVRRGHRLPLTGTTASLLVLIGLCLLGGAFYLKWKH